MRGIPTEKGERNRWIKATNALLRRLAGKVRAILAWLAEAKAILTEKPAPTPAQLLSEAFNQRCDSAYSRSGKIRRIQEHSRLLCFLSKHKLDTTEALASYAERMEASVTDLKRTMDENAARRKELKEQIS